MRTPEPTAALASALLALARQRGASLACAESLTGGALCAALVAVPGASDVVRGAVVAYQLDVKSAMLGVDGALLDQPGPVSEAVATSMAAGARDRLAATVGIATTGVAGPDPHGGRAPGTVCLAVAHDGGVATRTVNLDGDREAVRSGAVDAALTLAFEVLSEGSWPGGTQLG